MKYLLAGIGLVLSLAGCGGGGGGGGTSPSAPVASTLAFPFRSAVNTVTANGESYTLTANGTLATQSTDGLCSGTLTSTSAPANTSTTFEGVPALSALTTTTKTLTNCTPELTTGTETDYYDTSYAPLGFLTSSGGYGVFQTSLAVPITVRVGDSGIVGTYMYYTDSTKSVADGRSELSYLVEADTADTAILNLITKSYDQSSRLLRTTNARGRIDAAGTLTRISIDIQYATTSTTHLVFRR